MGRVVGLTPNPQPGGLGFYFGVYFPRRAVGKPKKRWEDAVQEDSVKLLGTKAWKTKAKDRQFWRQHIEETKAQYGL
jgi:hypothetical protein